MEKNKKILLGYALLLTITGSYFDIFSHQKTPFLGLLNLAFAVVNFTIIGVLLYQWDKVRRWNEAIAAAEAAAQTPAQTPSAPVPAAG
jgi:hypothetical protein